MKSVQRVRKLKIQRVLPGHNTLNISTTIINEIDDGFREIFDSGSLHSRLYVIMLQYLTDVFLDCRIL